MDLQIAGRTAFVSGATQGIGAAVADALAREGVNLFLVARSADRLARTASDLERQHHVRVAWKEADFSAPGGGEHAARAAQEQFAEIDILVNNAGQSLPGSLDTTTKEWATSSQLNFLSHLEVMRTLLPSMQQRRWGRIINIVGTSYRHPTDFSTGTIAKYGLLAASQLTARDVAQDGVTINAVTVGFIETPQITATLKAAPERGSVVLGQIPMGRLGRAAEVANGVLHFASAHTSYTTASTITVDGGADAGLL